MSAPPSTSPGAPPRRRADVSMSLLVDMMTDSRDPAYADRAERAARARAAGADADQQASDVRTGFGGPVRRATAALVLVALGLMTGTAVAHVRDRAAASTGVRTGLAAEVTQRATESEALTAQVEDLRREVLAGQDATDGVEIAGRDAVERLAELGLAAATTPVTGPGLVVVVDDAPNPDGTPSRLRGGSVAEGRILDRDLQDVVNGLWVAGAEAIAVNGTRLAALTAIRAAGEAILVDFRALSPPYVVEAVGDPAELAVRFTDGVVGRRYTTWAGLYGIGFDVQRADGLRLPAASLPDFRAVTPVEGPGAGTADEADPERGSGP